MSWMTTHFSRPELLIHLPERTCSSYLAYQFPMRQGNGVSMFWHTRERAQAEAPDGWKVERTAQGFNRLGRQDL